MEKKLCSAFSISINQKCNLVGTSKKCWLFKIFKVFGKRLKYWVKTVNVFETIEFFEMNFQY